MQTVELNELILSIYDTTINPDTWPDVLDRSARFIGATGAMIFELEGSGTERRIKAPYLSKIYDAALVQGYINAYHDEELIDQDIFTSLSKPTDQIHFVSDESLAETEQELLDRRNVRAMVENGIRYRMAALLNKDMIDRDRLALQFSYRSGPISKEHFDKALLVAPHIAKARNISRPTEQLVDSFRSVAASIDKLVIGICILDKQGRIVHHNQEFQRQLDIYPVFLKDRSGRLVMRSEKPAEALGKLRGPLSNHGRFGARPRKEAITSLIDDIPHTLCIEVAPLTTADEFGEPQLNGHIVYSMDAGNFYEIDGEMLAKIFSLTQTEASILELLAEGLTNAQISERRAKSVETVNSQVKSILEKTQSANRTQLIRLATNISSSFIVDRDHETR